MSDEKPISIFRPTANPKVVAALEDLLEQAKSGELSAFFLSGELQEGTVVFSRAGSMHRITMLGYLDRMKHTIQCDLDEDKIYD